MKTENERKGNHPEWVTQALYWLGAFSNVVNTGDMVVRISPADEGDKEDGVIEIDHWLIVEPWDVEITTILETTTMPGFAVSRVATSPGSYWEPPDVDIVFDSDYRNIADAIQGALLTRVENEMNGVAEHIGETQLAKEMADLCM